MNNNDSKVFSDVGWNYIKLNGCVSLSGRLFMLICTLVFKVIIV